MGDGTTYEPWKAIKSQVLADFVAEWTGTQLPLWGYKPLYPYG